MLVVRLYPLSAICFFLFAACSDPETNAEKPGTKPEPTKKEITEQFIKANKGLMQKENDDMDQYAKSHQMQFVRTSSGIRYYVYKPSSKGDSIRDSTIITIKYEVRLLNGTLCYSSKEEGKKTFMVGQGDIESGIHKGVKYLKKGDKALLLIPSPLAHGLLGDMKKIPPQMPIVYDIQVE